MSGTFNVPLYGINTWGDLFTARQKAMLVTLLMSVADSEREVVARLLAVAMGKLLRHSNVLAKWHRGSETVAGAFGMQALPMSWDYPEMYPLVPYAGGLADVTHKAEEASLSLAAVRGQGQAEKVDAASHSLPDETCAVWFTDPPYYFAVPYADLSDFFFVWLKRILPGHPMLGGTHGGLTPKEQELCEMARWDPVRYGYKDHQFYEDGMAKAFAEGRRVLREDGVGSVVFAHKTTEGWEALLSGMIRGGWTVTGSWPIATERGARLRARDSAALATSVHLICRPRPHDAPVGDWASVLHELPVRVAGWMKRLQEEGIRGADLVFACVGPALEVFSRYRAVETAEGRKVGLPEYLERVWQVVGRAALEQVLGAADAGTLEEDARLTALFLWTYQSTEVVDGASAKDANEEPAAAKTAARGLSLPYDVVRRFSQPMGIGLDGWTGRVIDQKKGVVRLLPVSERADELFGRDGAAAAAEWIERDPLADVQPALFPDWETTPTPRARRQPGARSILDPEDALQGPDATTLDRIHAGMLLQASGHANALRKLIAAEQDRGPAFLRLANALSALYPRWSREKRLLDAMILAVPR
ncbi:MAG: DUF1156 domain-containing protein [Gemmatimonadetes bacterium]|nr:DUF1156 domain-containing protein [Gemmatimonadota bacterium]MYJ10973.1 DUF1156 domain-containing protein [Gemmatimonadota bacterium]